MAKEDKWMSIGMAVVDRQLGVESMEVVDSQLNEVDIENR